MPDVALQDDHAVRLRTRLIGLGVATTYALCATFGPCIAFLTDGRHRTAIGVLLLVAALATFALSRLPAERLAAHPRAEAFFLGWSLGTIAIISAVAALDGGAASPANAAFFLPIVFAALAYPPRSFVLVSVLAVLAFVVVALVPADGGARPGLAYVALFATSLALAGLTCGWQARLQREARAELARAVCTDPLTGCLNRRGFGDRVEAALASGAPFALLQLDVDRFKAVNDAHGHAAGDRVLAEAVALARRHLRSGDAIGRLGGDEFAVLLRDADAAEADDVRARLAAVLSFGATISVGRACHPADGTTAEALHAAADRDLYARKRARGLHAAA